MSNIGDRLTEVIFSKENTSRLYSTIVKTHNLQLKSNEKSILSTNLVREMKNIFQTIQISKVNASNYEKVIQSVNQKVINSMSLMISKGQNNSNKSNVKISSRPEYSSRHDMERLDPSSRTHYRPEHFNPNFNSGGESTRGESARMGDDSDELSLDERVKRMEAERMQDLNRQNKRPSTPDFSVEPKTRKQIMAERERKALQQRKQEEERNNKPKAGSLDQFYNTITESTKTDDDDNLDKIYNSRITENYINSQNVEYDALVDPFENNVDNYTTGINPNEEFVDETTSVDIQMKQYEAEREKLTNKEKSRQPGNNLSRPERRHPEGSRPPMSQPMYSQYPAMTKYNRPGTIQPTVHQPGMQPTVHQPGMQPGNFNSMSNLGMQPGNYQQMQPGMHPGNFNPMSNLAMYTGYPVHTGQGNQIHPGPGNQMHSGQPGNFNPMSNLSIHTQMHVPPQSQPQNLPAVNMSDPVIQQYIRSLIQKQTSDYQNEINSLKTELSSLSNPNQQQIKLLNNELRQSKAQIAQLQERLKIIRNPDETLQTIEEKKKELIQQLTNLKEKFEQTEKIIKEQSDKKLELDDKHQEIKTLIAKNISLYNNIEKSEIVNTNNCIQNSHIYTHTFVEPVDILTAIEINDYSFPSTLHNITPYNNTLYIMMDKSPSVICDSSIAYNKVGNIHQLTVEPGNYDSDYLIQILSSVLKQLSLRIHIKQSTNYVTIYSDTHDFSLMTDYCQYKNNILTIFGFEPDVRCINEKSYTSSKSFDLRSDKSITIHILNVSKKAFCKLNMTSNKVTHCTAQLSTPLKNVTHFDIEFRDSKNNPVSFSNKNVMIDITLKTVTNTLKDIEIDSTLNNVITESELYDQITNMMN